MIHFYPVPCPHCPTKQECRDNGVCAKEQLMATKSTVNKAKNYTQPKKRKAIFNRIKAGGKGGKPGQWSARKAQMLAKQYKASGGGYKS